VPQYSSNRLKFIGSRSHKIRAELNAHMGVLPSNDYCGIHLRLGGAGVGVVARGPGGRQFDVWSQSFGYETRCQGITQL